MTNDETIIALLTEIRDLLKTASLKSAGSASSSAPVEGARIVPSEASWASFPWPEFTNKSGKRKAQTLGESVAAGDYGVKDLRWWAANYEPREYKGSISAKDTQFRAALTQAVAWLDSKVSGVVSETPAQYLPPAKTAPAPAINLDEDVPF